MKNKSILVLPMVVFCFGSPKANANVYFDDGGTYNINYEIDGDLWVDIDLDLCTGAGECVDVCPEDVYEVVNGKVKADKIGACIECAACDGVCPNDAILDQCSW